jgi:hypothetical protein
MVLMSVGPPDETSWAPALNPKAKKQTAPVAVLESLQGVLDFQLYQPLVMVVLVREGFDGCRLRLTAKF